MGIFQRLSDILKSNVNDLIDRAEDPEKMVKQIANPSTKKEKVSNPAEDAIYESLEEKMKSIMGTRVQIHRKKNDKGKIEIEYYGNEDLERVLGFFNIKGE